MAEKEACHGGMTATDLLAHAMDHVESDEYDRVMVFAFSSKGGLFMHTNARSYAEKIGMMELFQACRNEDEEED